MAEVECYLTLPDEIWLNIFLQGRFTPSELMTVSEVDKQLYRVSKDSCLYEKIAEQILKKTLTKQEKLSSYRMWWKSVKKRQDGLDSFDWEEMARIFNGETISRWEQMTPAERRLMYKFAVMITWDEVTHNWTPVVYYIDHATDTWYPAFKLRPVEKDRDPSLLLTPKYFNELPEGTFKLRGL